MGCRFRRKHMASLLEVRNLHVSYRSRTVASYPALADVSFAVAPGEILGVLGESGSGKSTLAMSLLRLLPPNGTITKGQILVSEADVLQMDARELRQLRGKCISLVSQEPSLALHPTMRIGDQVSEVLCAHEVRGETGRGERALNTLRRVFPAGAERIASCYPHQLSGGQRQRILIAQAIACEPALLVADEPTASLDPFTQHEILSLFKQLQQELGLGILFITHNPTLLMNFADRVLVLYGGKVVECGPTEAVLFAPQHPYTRALLRCLPSLDAAKVLDRKAMLPVIPGVAPNLLLLPQGCIFEPRCSDRMEACQTREPATVALNKEHEAACLKLYECPE
jgi:oligopeptide transport system ATP-binding protein